MKPNVYTYTEIAIAPQIINTISIVIVVVHTKNRLYLSLYTTYILFTGTNRAQWWNRFSMIIWAWYGATPRERPSLFTFKQSNDFKQSKIWITALTHKHSQSTRAVELPNNKLHILKWMGYKRANMPIENYQFSHGFLVRWLFVRLCQRGKVEMVPIWNKQHNCSCVQLIQTNSFSTYNVLNLICWYKALECLRLDLSVKIFLQAENRVMLLYTVIPSMK